jgi:uncharacterized protein
MRYFTLILLGLLMQTSYAATQVDLYKTDVAVESNDAKFEDQARIEGMKTVLIKVTGDRHVIDNADVKKALSNPEEYLSQFGVVNINEKRTLRMEFNAKRIRELLTKAHLALWPAERSNILVWLIEDQNFQRIIDWENIDSPNILQIKHIAAQRGLPITVPVGDFDDVTSVQVSDLWGGFVRPISIASQRYHPDAVLIIRDSGQSAHWTLFDQSPKGMVDVQITPQVGAAKGPNRLENIIDTITQFYVAKDSLVVEGESSKSILIQVDNLTNVMSFFSVERTLKSFSSIASVDIVKVGDLYAIYRLHLLASQKEFKNEVANNPNLILDQQLDQSEPIPETPVMLPSSNEEKDDKNSLPMKIRKSIVIVPDLMFHWQ